MNGTMSERNSAGKASMALGVIGVVGLAFGIELCTVERVSTNLATGSVNTTFPYLGIGVPLTVVGLVLAAWGVSSAKRNLGRGRVAGVSTGGLFSAGQGEQGRARGAGQLVEWKCSRCGTTNSNNSSICRSCEALAPDGAAVVPGAGQPEHAGGPLTCPNGHRVPAGFRWCRQCGGAGAPAPQQGP